MGIFGEENKPAASEGAVTLTKADLQTLLEAAVRAAKAPNALEQRELERQLEQDMRRSLAQVEFAKAEELAARRRSHGCTHRRHPLGSRYAGMSAPKGEGEWCTGRQIVGRIGEQIATLICMRCSYVWQFKPTNAEREYIESNGLLGFAPPPEETLVAQGVNL